ncbi:Eco57I restriction-modification methylase domain-containing protein [Marinitenerispora sediminis]|uniref:Eco57I restriction-modification methylase domain-containing protein n=1 Tax=Marinitenerispora sediminis TaxID=1931232 RepID=UPI001F2B15D9|nr:DNA methyltransferase [Marinitenerispora sediminis]
MDVLTEAFPQGLDRLTDELRGRVRRAWDEVQEAPGELRSQWTELILGEVLGWQRRYRAEPDRSDGGRHPDFALLGPGARGENEQRLHCYLLPWDSDLTVSRADRPSAVEQAAARCRRDLVPLALVTNGRLWALVHARPGGPTSVGVFDADLWLEERALLSAFATLLAGRRVQIPETHTDGSSPSGSTASLFARTANAQGKLTEELGEQVRRAVELLVSEIARLDREARGHLLADVAERQVYKGALTVLMRMVFLLYAEEQRLLPGDDLYVDHYSVTRLFDQLADDWERYGEEIVDRRAAAWPRLLALFNGIHAGVEHPDLRIPAYGGSLFDTGRFEWLTRLKVTDRVVFQILDALLMLRGKGRRTATRISYKALDVEDIGHIYEGLLEFSCLKVAEPYVGLIGKHEPELPLRELEEQRSVGEEEFLAWLLDQTGATRRQLEKGMGASPKPEQLADLRAAADSDDELAARTAPFWGLLRTDLRDDPTIFPAGSVLFTQVGDRRRTGTHYTPRAMAETVVEHTLAPLVYAPGPADGAERETWRVKPADELLKLKIVDPAMGSGAFLVSACRYLADRIVEAWLRDGVPEEVRGAVDGDDSLDELRLFAKRRVAASCVYGVDRDDMAVELAKLSLWLETLAKNKPFSFLDHALRCGDSLVGLVSEEQLRAFHTDPVEGRQVNSRWVGKREGEATSIADRIEQVLAETTRLRKEIEAAPVLDPVDVQRKTEMLREAEEQTELLRLAADAVIAAAIAADRYPDLDDKRWVDGDAESKKLGWRAAYNHLVSRLSDEVAEILDEATYNFKKETQLRERVEDWLTGKRDTPIRPLHWALEFPEVMGDGGFDAVVGNPPFIGGQRLTGTLGTDVREYLVADVAGGKRGSADLCSYFLLRNLRLAPHGRTGIIATNTIAQGDTREVGLDQVTERGWTIYRAVKSQPWPGSANVHVSLVWAGHAGEKEKYVLGEDEVEVRGITPSLDARSRVTGKPFRLVANEGQAFQGSIVLGEGFILQPEEAHALIERDPKNKEVLFPYLNGKDLNSRPDSSPSRWVIDFGDLSEEQAREYREPFDIVQHAVKPFREQNKRKVYRDYWWQFAEKRPALQGAVSGLKNFFVLATVSSTALPVFVEAQIVVSHTCVVFPSDDFSVFSLLSSSVHGVWAAATGSTLKGDLRYTPSDIYETFPLASLGAGKKSVGEDLNLVRVKVMFERQIGLTKLYGLINSSTNHDSDIVLLRKMHIEMDKVVASAYGWDDLDLGHGHYETPRGLKWTVHPQVQVEILDRLLELNHARHRQEQEAGLRPGARKRRKAKPKPPRPIDAVTPVDGALFPPDGALF